jgi:hypothetical protein
LITFAAITIRRILPVELAVIELATLWQVPDFSGDAAASTRLYLPAEKLVVENVENIRSCNAFASVKSLTTV